MRGRHVVEGATAVCTKCSLELPYTTDWFYKSVNPASRKRLQARCKTCCTDDSRRRRRTTNPEKLAAWRSRWRLANPGRWAAAQRRWRLANVEQVVARQRQWAQTHPLARRANVMRRIARKAGAEGKYTAEDVVTMLKDQAGRCFYCEEALNRFDVEHKVPLVRGGSNWPSNLCVSCPGCNGRKGTKTAEEFMGAM